MIMLKTILDHRTELASVLRLGCAAPALALALTSFLTAPTHGDEAGNRLGNLRMYLEGSLRLDVLKQLAERSPDSPVLELIEWSPAPLYVAGEPQKESS